MIKKIVVILFFFSLVSCNANNTIKEFKTIIDDNNSNKFMEQITKINLEDDDIKELLEYILVGESVDYSIKGYQDIDFNKFDIITTLIGNSNDPNILLEDGSHIIFWSLRFKDTKLFKALVNNKNTNFNIKDKRQYNLSLLLRFNEMSIGLIKTMLQNGLNVASLEVSRLEKKKHPLYKIIYSLESKKVIEVLNFVSDKNIFGWSIYDPLFDRYRNNKIKNVDDGNYLIFKTMKERGFNLKYTTPDGATLLHQGITTADIRIVRDLLDSGVDVNAKYKGEYTAMFYGGLELGGGPGREKNPMWDDIKDLILENGYVPIDY